MESELFEDWHLPTIPLPQPTLTLPNLLSDYFCDVTSFEDAMDESLARLALFNVSGKSVIISNKYSVNYDLLFQATHMADFSHVQSIHTTSLGESSTTQLHLRVAGSPGMGVHSQYRLE